MFFSVKYALIFLLLLNCCVFINAQQNPTVLPSLISDQTSHSGNVYEDDEVRLKQKMFVKVFTNKNKIYVGEPLMATYIFYVAANIADQPSVTKQPEFTGFSVKELSFDQMPEAVIINNEEYKAYVIRKVQLTPLQRGTLSLGKAYVDNFVEEINPIDPFVTKKFNIVINNPEAAVEVSELPEKNKPKDFYGITGVFKITAQVSDNKIPVGENGHLIIKINGSGNLEAINAPAIEWPANAKHFDGSDSQHIDQDNFPVSGDKIFDIPFVGVREGMIKIPSVRFSFFNTASKKYETVNTQSIAVNFTKALSKKDSFKSVVNHEITNRKYLWIVPAIAVIVALVGFISYKKNKAITKQTKPEVSITVAPVFTPPPPVYHIKFRTDFSKHLDELKNITDNKLFFARAKELLVRSVAERLESKQHSENILLAELKEKIYDAPVCNKLSGLFEAINLNLYAPFETQADLAFYFNEVKNVIEELQAEG